MLEDIAEEIMSPDLSGLKRIGIDEIALVKEQKNYCAVCNYSGVAIDKMRSLCTKRQKPIFGYR
jgi:hypothetical protein